MSDFVVHRWVREPRLMARGYVSVPIGIHHTQGRPSETTFDDGSVELGSCLGCGDTPCMLKRPDELAVAQPFGQFPGDPSRQVCPVDALVLNSSANYVWVNEERCVGCGLCVVRCPYGAAFIDHTGVARISTIDSPMVEIGTHVRATVAHPKPAPSGLVLESESDTAGQIPAVVRNMPEARASQFVRNLMHELGVPTAMRRVGDTNVRLDGVGLTQQARAVVIELEIQGDVLDSPRALAEDVAILVNRYQVDKESIIPVSVVMEVPPSRSDYHNVMLDFERVLGLRCRTITLGLLLSLIWSCDLGNLDLDHSALFSSDAPMDLSPYLRSRGLAPVEPYPGALRALK